MSSINLKPNKPDTYDGTREYVTVNTWLYTIEQYLSLTQLSSPNTPLTDHNKIAFASSYLKGNAAVWWFHIVNSQESPATWGAFKARLISEFIPADHCRRARDKLRTLKQTSSVEHYLSEYRNTILMIGDMHEGEKVDRFVDGLKYNVRVEVLKTNCSSFEECARLALNVDSAIWRARRGNSGFHYTNNRVGDAGPTPMEIGNLNSGTTTRAHREQRKKDLENGACFKCHKVGCRPWKCRNTRVNNVEAESISPGDETVPQNDSGNGVSFQN